MLQDTGLPSHELEALASRSRTLSYPSLVSTKQLYASFPLPADSYYIRLLDLEASSTTRQAKSNVLPLKGRLRVERLVESLSFTALSYVWGNDDTTTHAVSCQPQGCNIPITANCHAALCQIRKQCGAVTLWVDSICVNQADNGEKSSQIPLMQEIYSWAEVVYIWLGEGNRQSDKTMRYLENRALLRARLPFTWLAVMSTRPAKKKQEMVKFRHRTLKDPFGRLGVAASYGSHKVHLNEVLDREWVRRAWTLQEVVLAPNPIILCGDKILHWEDLIHAIYDPDDDFLRDCSRDPFERARVESLIARWRSIIDIWLNLPRSCPDLPLEIAQGPSAFSLATLAKHLNGDKKVPRGPRALTLICAIWRRLLGIICLALWAYCTYAAMASVNSRTSISITKKVNGIDPFTKFCVWAMLILVWLFPGVIFLSFVRRCLRFSCFILCGRCSDWVWKRDTSSGTQVLSGIHVALRERACTNPLDRSFALFGILRSLGASLSRPDVQGAVGETYRLFLQSLLTWQPSSLAMIVDAGYPTEDGPSWVPNWMFPSPSAWLTRRYTIGSPTSATQQTARSFFAVYGNELRLQGQFKGAVCFLTRLKPVEQQDDEETLKSSLDSILCSLLSIRENVSQQDPYDVGESFVFAVLRGLTPPRGPTSERIQDIDGMGSPGMTRDVPLPRWKGPYNFGQQVQDFKTFCRLYELLQSCLPPIPSENPDQATPQEIDIDAAVDSIKSNGDCYKCFVEIINVMVAEKRCVFVLDSGFVGSGPIDMEIGDEAFLLAGVPVPMVLCGDQRKEGFTVRGAALVHGLMHGELFDSKKLEGITLV